MPRKQKPKNAPKFAQIQRNSIAMLSKFAIKNPNECFLPRRKEKRHCAASAQIPWRIGRNVLASLRRFTANCLRAAGNKLQDSIWS